MPWPGFTGGPGEKKYGRAALEFVSPKWYRAMEEETDGMNLLTVASGISQAQTLLELYQADGTALEEKRAAEYFWETATKEYSYVTGSPGVEGSFRSRAQAVEQAPGRDRESQRICMRMLDFTWLLHEANPQEPEYLDYYERVLFNQKLEGFGESACAKSRMFEERGEKLYLNFYLPTGEVLEKNGLKIQMEMEPYGESATISIKKGTGKPEASVDLYLRVPSWCAETFQARLNGKAVEARPTEGYVRLTGVKASDTISVSFPFSCYLEEGEQGRQR